jgi:hypothetical protein
LWYNKYRKKEKERLKTMMYGNNSNGFAYSPDRRNDKVNHDNLHSSFIGANGSRQGGYYYSANNNNYSYGNKSRGHYDGRGQWVED